MALTGTFPPTRTGSRIEDADPPNPKRRGSSRERWQPPGQADPKGSEVRSRHERFRDESFPTRSSP